MKGLFVKLGVLSVFVFVLALFSATVFAVPSSPVDITKVSSERRNLSSLPSQSVEAQAGNVTELSINALSVTRFWQGFYGNVTGAITLDDANNNTLYNWSVVSPEGEVYATRAANPDFSSVQCADATAINSEATAIGQTGSESDHITKTFNHKSHPAFSVGTTNIAANTCNSTNTFVNDASQSSDFYEVLLTDASSNFVYTAIIDADTTGFDGKPYDFQMLVGEDGTSAGTTTYYFFVELS